MSGGNLIIPKSLIQQTEERVAAKYQHYYESIYVPWNEHLNNLKYLTNTIDTLTVLLPDKQLIEAIRSLRVSHEGGIEAELAGSWYGLLSLASAVGLDLKSDWPDIAEATNTRLLALRELLHQGNPGSLRQAVRNRPDLSGLMPPTFGRPVGITPLTDFLGSWGDQLITSGLSYAAAAARIIRQLEPRLDLSEVEQNALDQLESRPENKTTGKKVETRGDYLKGIVNRWRKAMK